MAQFKAHGRIDAHVQAAAECLQARQLHLQVKEIVLLVRAGIPQTRLRGFGGVLQAAKRVIGDWADDLEKALLAYVEKRARDYLHQTKSFKFRRKGERVEVRLFEHHEDAQGRHLWKPIQAMTADELALCIQQRMSRLRAEEVRIDVYEEFLNQLRQYPVGSTVQQVFDKVLEADAN